MHIYIDESGNFSGQQHGKLSLVGALAIPDGKLAYLTRKFNKLKSHFPHEENGEIKGRLLNEKQVCSVIDLLASCDVIYEVTANDTGRYTQEEISAQITEHAEHLRNMVEQNPQHPMRVEIQADYNQISSTSIPLYLQAVTTFDLLHRLVAHVPIYYSHHSPEELAEFFWVVDGKSSEKVTAWEAWLSNYLAGAISALSIKKPAIQFDKGADYTYFNRYIAFDANGRKGIEAKRLLENFTFSATTQPGLELIDILVNATRRALLGNLQESGWRNLGRLMIHRNDIYIKLITFGGGEAGYEEHHMPYGHAVHKISRNGKLLFPMHKKRKI